MLFLFAWFSKFKKWDTHEMILCLDIQRWSTPEFAKSQNSRNFSLTKITCFTVPPKTFLFQKIPVMMKWFELIKGILFYCPLISVLLTVGSAAFISGIFCISAFRTYRIMLRRRHRGRPLVVMAELPHHVPNGNSASSPLLYDDQEDEEEIPWYRVGVGLGVGGEIRLQATPYIKKSIP